MLQETGKFPCSPRHLSGCHGRLLTMQPPTPQESVRVSGTASPLHSRPGRWVAEVWQDSVAVLMGLAEPPSAVLPRCSSASAGGSSLPLTCRFLSMSQLVSKSSSSSPKGLMSCSATCVWRAHSKGHGGQTCPSPCREKAGGAEPSVMAPEFGAMLPPRNGWAQN